MTGRDPSAEAERGRRRLRAFMIHLAAYFAAVVAMIALNQALDPGEPWFLLPMIGWGGVLALHAAHVMGLLDALFGRGRR